MSLPYDDNTYRCSLLRVVDGDTLQIKVDLGLRVERMLYIRITNINAPEVRGPEREAGKLSSKAAEAVFQELIATGEPVLVKFKRGKSFDRWLGRVFVVIPNGRSLDFGDLMVKRGAAVAIED